MANPKSRTIVISNVTILYPVLLSPRAVKGRNGEPDGRPVFSIKALVPTNHPQLNDLYGAVNEVAKVAGFFNEVDKKLRYGIRSPFTLGDDIASEKGEYYRGNIVFNAKSSYAPTLADPWGHEIARQLTTANVTPETEADYTALYIKNPAGEFLRNLTIEGYLSTEPTMAKDVIYSGMKAMLTMFATSYDTQGKGIKFILTGVQIMPGGQRISTAPVTEFKPAVDLPEPTFPPSDSNDSATVKPASPFGNMF